MVYVGKTSRPVNERWLKHATDKKAKTRIGRSLIKYGHSNFEFSVIDIAESEESLTHKEIFWIKTLNTVSPNGYNLTHGGEGSSLSEETKEKLSKIFSLKHGVTKGRAKSYRERTPEEIKLWDERVRLNRSNAQKGRDSPMKGKKHSKESLAKMSENRKGIVAYTKIVTRSDGVVFESLKDAAEDSGTNKPNITSQIKGLRHNAGGFQFKYGVHDAWVVTGKPNYFVDIIVCSNGKEYTSIVGIGRELGVSKFLLNKSLKSGEAVKGFTFKYKEEVAWQEHKEV